MKDQQDKLEEFISGNRENFNEKPDVESMWAGIEGGLEEKPVRKVKIWQIAAAAAILIAVSISVYNGSEQAATAPMNCEADVSLKAVSTELAEVELYYAASIEEKMAKIEALGVEQTYLVEVEELDNEFHSLKADMCESMDNELVVEAMLMNYKMRLEILQSIIDEVEA